MRGIYILVIEVSKNVFISIGKKSVYDFKKGKYLYVGSALGPGKNALENRINRHLKNSNPNKEENKNDKSFHWHIDYLLDNENTNIEKVFYKEIKNPKKQDKEKECKTAEKIEKSLKPKLIKNFGSTDCKCKSHLFQVKNLKQILNSQNLEDIRSYKNT